MGAMFPTKGCRSNITRQGNEVNCSWDEQKNVGLTLWTLVQVPIMDNDRLGGGDAADVVDCPLLWPACRKIG